MLYSGHKVLSMRRMVDLQADVHSIYVIADWWERFGVERIGNFPAIFRNFRTHLY